ncbi:MAG: GTPase Era [Bacillota bacterium]
MDSELSVSGFVAVVGFSNVGKSTLVNRLVGQKVSIVSGKPQTTRNRIRGILNDDDMQIVFVDTPGIQKPRDRLEEHMVAGARSAMGDVDLNLLVVDGARRSPGRGDRACAHLVDRAGRPAILVVNKMDAVPAERREERVRTYSALGDFAAVLGISALHGWNVDALRDEIVARLPSGPRYFPPDMTSDQPMPFLVAELIREKILEVTEQEVPYSVAVAVVSAEERPGGKYYLAADILVERESQKGILIGAGGRMIKTIGERSREEVERVMEVDVYLDLHVRVQRRWRDSHVVLRELGLRWERE